jgi:hypothetical protein
VLALVLAAVARRVLLAGEVGVVLGGLALEVGPVFSGRLVAVQLVLVVFLRSVLRRVLFFTFVLFSGKEMNKLKMAHHLACSIFIKNIYTIYFITWY